MSGPTVTNDDSGTAVTPGAILNLSQGGTGSNLSATGGTNQVLKQAGVGANVTVAPLTASDIPAVWQTFTPVLTASAGTWSGGSVPSARYMVLGKTIFINFEVDSSSVSATPQQLRIAIPGGFVAAYRTSGSVNIQDGAAAWNHGNWQVGPAGAVVAIVKQDYSSTFSTTSGATNVQLLAIFEVQ